jgi:2-hydroxymuconate-semialdehyde hydrolase
VGGAVTGLGQLKAFGRCGHWTQIEHAAAFAELVTDFLTEGR